MHWYCTRNSAGTFIIFFEMIRLQIRRQAFVSNVFTSATIGQYNTGTPELMSSDE